MQQWTEKFLNTKKQTLKWKLGLVNLQHIQSANGLGLSLQPQGLWGAPSWPYQCIGYVNNQCTNFIITAKSINRHLSNRHHLPVARKIPCQWMTPLSGNQDSIHLDTTGHLFPDQPRPLCILSKNVGLAATCCKQQTMSHIVNRVGWSDSIQPTTLPLNERETWDAPSEWRPM